MGRMEQQGRRGGRRHWAHTRLVSGPWLACAVVLPVVLAVVASLASGGATEDDLVRRTTSALAAQGVSGADVTFDGVVGRVALKVRQLPDGLTSRDVQRIVDGVEGARSVDVSVTRRTRPSQAPRGTRPATAAPTPTPSPTPAPTGCDDPQAAIDALLGPDRVAFGNNGSVLPDDQRAEVEQVAALLVRCGTRVEVVGHTADRAPAGSTIGIDRARAVAAVLEAAGAEVSRAVGRRGDDPIGDNSTQAGRVLNRYAAIVARR